MTKRAATPYFLAKLDRYRPIVELVSRAVDERIAPHPPEEAERGLP